MKKNSAEKKRGCLTSFIIVLALLALGAAGLYFLLPSLISNALNGGTVAALLPETVKEQTELLGKTVKDNIGMLDQAGISVEQARMIVEDMNYKKADTILAAMESGKIANIDDLIKTAGQTVDLSSLDTEKLKSHLNTDFNPVDFQEAASAIRKNPGFSPSGFLLLKNTVLKVLEEEERSNTDK